MQGASASLDFEAAAGYRDQIAALQSVAENQDIDSQSGDLDVIGAAQLSGINCVQIMMVRDGRILGSRAHYPKVQLDETLPELLSAFIAQHYINNSTYRCPPQLLVSETLSDAQALAEVLTEVNNRKVAVLSQLRGRRARWLSMAKNTALQNCQSRLADRNNSQQRNASLAAILKLEAAPERLECFDISHSHGELTVASCVVFDANGPLKSDYRRFNIDGDYWWR
jgi:Nuclease subunit of the excinuclease complex